MKKVLLTVLAASALATAAMPAAAQSWQSINQRQANLDQRIDRGVRQGDLTRREAQTLRGEFRTLVNLEARYRSDRRFTQWERTDLDRRFDALSQRVRYERRDRDDRGRDDRGRDDRGRDDRRPR